MGPLIVEYYSGWPALFDEEAVRVVEALGRRCAAVEHIGSTAVPGLPAKPVIDLLVALRGPLTSRDSRAVRRLGYSHLRARRNGRLIFRRGAPRTHSLHVTELGTSRWRAALLFRDYLRVNPLAAARYAELKLELTRLDSRAAYGEGKAAFIAATLREAALEPLGGESDRAGSRTLRATEV